MHDHTRLPTWQGGGGSQTPKHWVITYTYFSICTAFVVCIGRFPPAPINPATTRSPPMETALDACFTKHGTDKASTWHNYARQYGPLFERFRIPWGATPLKRYLEIGVQGGQSLRAMADLFPGAVVVGVDIDPAAAKHADPANNIHVVIGNATDPAVLANVLATFGPFDIVLDDGSHRCSDVVRTFEGVFPTPLLADGGLYIVEDVTVVSVPYYADMVPHTNHVQYFVQYLTVLNSADKNPGLVADPFKVVRVELDPIARAVDKVEFGCGYIAITKLERCHWRPGSAPPPPSSNTNEV